MKKKLLAALLAVSMLAATACGSETADSSSAATETADAGEETAESKDLVIGWGKLDTLDSRNTVSAYAYQVITLCGEGLLRNVNGEAQPGLAESYEVNETNTEYTFHLRQSTYADGTALTAEDIAFALKSLLNPENACAASTVSPAYKLVGAEGYLYGESGEEELGIEN